MENSELRSNTKEKMASAKPPLRPNSSFQVLQKTIYGDAAGTSRSPPQAPNGKNKVENHPARDAASSASIVDSYSKLADQIQTEKFDMDPKMLRRMMSNRLSSRRSWLKKSRYLTNLKTQVKTLEDEIANIQPQLGSHQYQKQFLLLEQQTLHQQIGILQKEMLLKHAEIEMNQREVNKLRELQMMQQEPFQAQLLNWNIGLQEPVSNDPTSNYYTNSYQVAGNGVESSYTQPEQNQMWIPSVPNVHEAHLSLPNYMGSMEMNDSSGSFPNRNLH